MPHIDGEIPLEWKDWFWLRSTPPPDGYEFDWSEVRHLIPGPVVAPGQIVTAPTPGPDDPAASPAEPALPDPSPSPPPPSTPSPVHEWSLSPLPALRGSPSDRRKRSRAKIQRIAERVEAPLERLAAGLGNPSTIIFARRRPIDIPKPYGVRIPRGTPKHPSGREAIEDKFNKAVGRAIDKAVEAFKKKRGRGYQRRRPEDRDAIEQRARRAMEETIRRKMEPLPQLPGRFPAGAAPPRPAMPGKRELEQIIVQAEREHELGIPPVPAPVSERDTEPLPIPQPEVDPAPVQIPGPARIPKPVPVPRTVPIPAPRPAPTPAPQPIPGLARKVAAAVFANRPRSRTRIQDAPQPAIQPAPAPTPAPAPSPTPDATPGAQPAPEPLTRSNPSSATSPQQDRCKTPGQQRKDDKRKRDEKRK